MGRPRRLVVVFTALLPVLFLAACTPRVTPSEICRDILPRALRLSTDWLIGGQKPDGFFTYEVRPFRPGAAATDNIVRQIGTFWGLVRVQAVDDRRAVRRAVRRFRLAVLPFVKRDRSPPGGPRGDIARIEFDGVSKLNSAALYLLALASLKRAGLKLMPEERARVRPLIDGIKRMAAGDGGFWYLYDRAAENNRMTPYGSGEAVYALAMWAHATGDARLKDYARTAFKDYYDHYLRRLDGFGSKLLKGYFAWALHAQPFLGGDDEASRYRNYIRPMLAAAMNHRARNPLCADKGCINAPTAGEASFLEGIIAAYPIVRRHEEDDAFAETIRTYIPRALYGLVLLQVTAADEEIFAKSPKAPERLIGGFCANKNCPFMRNDLNQHAAIAMLGYRENFCGPRGRRSGALF